MLGAEGGGPEHTLGRTLSIQVNATHLKFLEATGVVAE